MEGFVDNSTSTLDSRTNQDQTPIIGTSPIIVDSSSTNDNNSISRIVSLEQKYHTLTGRLQAYDSVLSDFYKQTEKFNGLKAKIDVLESDRTVFNGYMRNSEKLHNRLYIMFLILPTVLTAILYFSLREYILMLPDWFKGTLFGLISISAVITYFRTIKTVPEDIQKLQNDIEELKSRNN